ncbi:hypothetical protein BGW42_003689 [Actinomortierella wolfii]|nr:hypothetical protein BGW42_003689 [Actinomortierella wolfii]
MQSTRWRLAVDSPSTNHRSHQQQQQQRDDNDTQSLITKDRQRKPGQKHGDIIPVPEMFDAELNEAKVELMNHAVYRQRRAHRPKDNEGDDDKNSVFCKTCRNNHRLTYQMMSAYLPDEDDPDYERLLNNIEHKRKVLEQRYPPVCDECLPKVEQVLAHQHANLRINLFNAALKKSKVDHIRYIRKYPRLSWIFAAFLWICGNTVLLLIHYYAAGLPDLLPPLGRGDLLKQPALLAQDLIKAIARPNLFLSALAAGFIIIILLDFLWNPLQFSLDRSPHGQLRTRPIHKLTQIGSIPLRITQCWSLYSLAYSPPAARISACLFLLQLGFCGVFFISRYIRDPVIINLAPSRSPRTHAAHDQESEATLNPEDENQHERKHSIRSEPYGRTAGNRREEENPFSGRARSTLHRQPSMDSNHVFGSRNPVSAWESRSSSPDNDNINWSPRKPRQAGDAGRLPPQFGMYRDPSDPVAQRNIPTPGHSNEQERAAFIQGGLQPLNPSNKFHSRAYEPSPLAHPSMVMEAAQKGTSLGEIFGFPSARFQPPENHFAHRSTAPQDMWSYRRREGSHSDSSRPKSLLDYMDSHDVHELEDDDEDDDLDDSDGGIRGIRGPRPKLKHRRKESTSDVEDIFGSFGFSSSTASTHHRYSQKNNRDGEMFNQQRFFPPDANLGLEDNFWGAVKIADDELPDLPRTREGRNMAMKKRLAIRWLLVGFCSRAVAHYASVPSITLSAIILFVAVLLHAIGFWIVDERQSRNLLGGKTGQGELEKFKPVLLDKVFSVPNIF